MQNILQNVLAWLGFVGRLVQFCVEKLIGRRIELALDQKKRAAAAFIRMYNSLQALELVCTQFLQGASPVVRGEQRRLRGAWFRSLSEQTDRASTDFLASAREVVGVLEIIDPALPLMLGQIRQGKFIFLALSSGFDQMTYSLDLNEDATAIKNLTYTAPSEELEAFDLEGIYSTAQKWGNRPFVERDWKVDEIDGELVVERVATEWPKDALMNLLEGRFVQRILPLKDVEQIKCLYSLMQQHLAILTRSRETLRVLYVGQGRRYEY
jgi:hypothetical protein